MTAVDARVWPVSDTTIDCRFLRTRSPETIEQAESTERLLLQAAGAIAVVAGLFVIQDRLNLENR